MGVSTVTISIEEFEKLVKCRRKCLIAKRLFRRGEKIKRHHRKMAYDKLTKLPSEENRKNLVDMQQKCTKVNEYTFAALEEIFFMNNFEV